MARISLDFLADVSSFLRGTDDVERALDDVADALDGLQDESSDATRALDDDLDRIAKDADDAADKTEKSFRDAFDEMRSESSRASRDVSDDFDRAARGADEFKDEAASSAREGAASFSGEFEDVADFLQETLANALSGLGPVGAAAGLAAAAGIGILVSGLQNSAEKAEESKERIIDLADQIREVDGDLSRLNTDEIFLDWSSQISDTKQWFELWQDSPQTNIEQLATAADELGLSMGDLRAALQDVDGPEAQRVTELLNERLGTGMDEVFASTDRTTQALITLRGAINDGALDLESATELYGLQDEALGENAAALDYAREATETYNESVQDSLTEAGDKWAEYTENGITDLDAYAQAMEDQIAAVEEYQSNMETVSRTLSDNALAYLQNMGIEAAPLLESFVNAPTEQQDRIAAIWDQLGSTAVDGYGAGLSGLTGKTNAAVDKASQNADPVQLTFSASSWDAQKTVNDSMAKVVSPIVKIRYTAVNPVGVKVRRD